MLCNMYYFLVDPFYQGCDEFTKIGNFLDVNSKIYLLSWYIHVYSTLCKIQ